MAHTVTHASQAKVAIGTAVLGEIDSGTAGSLKLQNDGQTATYATIPLSSTSATVNGTTGVLTFQGTPLSDTDTAAGTAVKGTFYDSAAGAVMTCSVGIGATFDINLSNNVFGVGDTVSITSLTYTPPA